MVMPRNKIPKAVNPNPEDVATFPDPLTPPEWQPPSAEAFERFASDADWRGKLAQRPTTTELYARKSTSKAEPMT